MRNLALLDSLHCNVGVTGCNKLAYDVLNEVVYFATDVNIFGFLPKDRQACIWRSEYFVLVKFVLTSCTVISNNIKKKKNFQKKPENVIMS